MAERQNKNYVTNYQLNKLKRRMSGGGQSLRHALTFTGYESKIYNGSENVSVEIPYNLSQLNPDRTHQLVTLDQIGIINQAARILDWFGLDERNNAIYVKKDSNNNPRNFYAFGNVAAGGIGSGGGGGATYLYQLEDVEPYSNKQGKYLRVNANGTGTEWVDVQGGVTSFDNLTGRPSYNGAAMTSATNIPEVRTSYWNRKQDAISDLTTIRTRADEGHTAYGYFSNGKLSASLVSGLATVATSGAYSDLSGKPTIPTKAEDITAQNAVAFYDSGVTSPNDVLHSLALLKKDTPTSNFWFVNTYFYNSMSTSKGRAQLAIGYPLDELHIRRYYNGAWNDWKAIIHSGNIGSQNVAYATSAGNASTLENHSASYFATASSLGNYLPLRGGTMTGQLILRHSNVNQIIVNSTNANVTSLIRFEHNDVELGRIGFRGEDLFVLRTIAGAYNPIYHSGNCNNTSTPWNCSNLTASGNILRSTSGQSIGTSAAPWGEIHANKWYPNANDTTNYIEYTGSGFLIHGNVAATGGVAAGN